MHILFVAAVLIISVMTPNLLLADDFGDRFYNKAPSGLGDYSAPVDMSEDIAMDDKAADLQDIMPASGEEDQDGAEAVIIDIQAQENKQ